MPNPLAHRFDRIVHENLSKRKEMMDVLMENPIPTSIFHTKGSGLKTILKNTGRIEDFKGIYAFIREKEVLYLEESAYVLRRIWRHYKGVSKYQLKLAHTIVDFKKGDRPFYTISDALKDMEDMEVVFMDLPDELERQLTTLYLQCQYECIYNRIA